MDIAAVVILFYPDKSTIDNLLSYSSFVDTLYAIDNSENPSARFTEEIKKIPNCIYLHDGENKGIASRLNQACKLAKERGFSWLLTMDQDSQFLRENISTYISCVRTMGNIGQIAMTGVEITNGGRANVPCQFTEVTTLITSGSIINLSLFDRIGAFDEALFIDQVDLEYCYRAVLNGYKIVQFKHIFLKHSLGVVSVHKSLKNLKDTHRTLHSPVRLYYITRNYLYVRSKYKKIFRREISITRKDLFIRLKNNLLYGKQRAAVIKYFLKGIIDFKRGKMGKL